MARLLNQGVLPAGYYAVPLVDRDGPTEIDVAALQDQEGSGFERRGVRADDMDCARPRRRGRR